MQLLSLRTQLEGISPPEMLTFLAGLIPLGWICTVQASLAIVASQRSACADDLDGGWCLWWLMAGDVSWVELTPTMICGAKWSKKCRYNYAMWFGLEAVETKHKKLSSEDLQGLWSLQGLGLCFASLPSEREGGRSARCLCHRWGGKEPAGKPVHFGQFPKSWLVGLVLLIRSPESPRPSGNCTVWGQAYWDVVRCCQFIWQLLVPSSHVV